MIKLKNYTTGINAEKSIMEIEYILSQFGATAIMKEMQGDGKTNSIAFKIGEKGYKIPVNLEGVYQVMFGNKRVRYGTNNMANRHEQSYKTAWRIIKDWIYSQMSIIASGQSQPDEILLPYLWDGKRTLYQAYKNGTLQIENKEEAREE